MIERDGTEQNLVCDATGTRYPKTYDNCEFFTMLSEAKGDGWRIVQKNGEWRHYSPSATDANVEFEPVEGLD